MPPGRRRRRAKALDLTLRPGRDVFKEPYLTLVGSAGWGNPVADRGQPGYGIAGAIPVESMDPTMNDPRAWPRCGPCSTSPYASRLIELATSGKHHDVKADPVSLHRLIAWVDACCPFMGEEEIRALGDPDFAGIEELPIRPRVRTAPVMSGRKQPRVVVENNRPDRRQDLQYRAVQGCQTAHSCASCRHRVARGSCGKQAGVPNAHSRPGLSVFPPIECDHPNVTGKSTYELFMQLAGP